LNLYIVLLKPFPKVDFPEANLFLFFELSPLYCPGPGVRGLLSQNFSSFPKLNNFPSFPKSL